MKQSDLKCPWGCKGHFEVEGFGYKRNPTFSISHECEKLDAINDNGHFKTRQEAMKNWNSWRTK